MYRISAVREPGSAWDGAECLRSGMGFIIGFSGFEPGIWGPRIFWIIRVWGLGFRVFDFKFRFYRIIRVVEPCCLLLLR